MSGILLDLIVVAFIVLCAWVFKKKGLVMALFSFVSFVISFFAGSLLSPVVFQMLIKLGIISLSSKPLTLLLVNIVIYISISVIIMILLFVIGRVLNIFTKLPLIGMLNSWLGILLGIFIGISVCCVVFSLLSIADAWVDVSKFQNIIEKSYISEIFYKNNLFFLLQ